MTPTRRNIIPNPLPKDDSGWNHSEVNATLEDFFDVPGHYKAVATDNGCQTGIVWNDAREITVRPEEGYGVSLDIDVDSRPDVGWLRVLALWKEADGVTPVATWFSDPLPVGFTQIREVIESPPGAFRVAIAVLYQTTGAMVADTVTPIEFVAERFLLEPLGPSFSRINGSETNLIPNPSLEVDASFWLPHTHEDNSIEHAVWEVQDGWFSRGSQSLRQTINATDSILPGTTFYGFIGSYVGSFYSVEPGDKIYWQCDVNVLDAPVAGPGVFLEIFFYYYDGDPAHTVEILHLNGDSINQPIDIGVPQTLKMMGECPEGANIAQVTCVLVSGEADATLDFYTDAAMLTINQLPENYFDGDSSGAAWDGFRGRSVSRTPGKLPRLPGDWFYGEDDNAQWEGVPHYSMSTINPPILNRHSELNPEAMRLMVASSRINETN